jgi:type I site-specific restriction endonuclease
MNRKLVLEQRDVAVAAKITEYLKATDRYAKTIVFCEDIDHAARMRQALSNANADLCANPAQIRGADHRRQHRGQAASSTTSSTPRKPTR